MKTPWKTWWNGDPFLVFSSKIQASRAERWIKQVNGLFEPVQVPQQPNLRPRAGCAGALVRYGFAASQPILDEREREAWEAHVDSYWREFTGKGADHGTPGLLADLVRRVALCVWEQDRLNGSWNVALEMGAQFQAIVAAGLGEMRIEKLALRHFQTMAFDASLRDGSRREWRAELNAAERRVRSALKDLLEYLDWRKKNPGSNPGPATH